MVDVLKEFIRWRFVPVLDGGGNTSALPFAASAKYSATAWWPWIMAI
jgi:hypothetical protein